MNKINILEKLLRFFNVDELKAVTSSTKCKKLAGFDDIYLDSTKILEVVHWNGLLFFLSRLPAELKKIKMIAVLKKEKPLQETSSYRPISVLRVYCYQSISPIAEGVLFSEQAGFWLQGSFYCQVLALTNHIETIFEKSLKTGIFLDLTATYDEVRKNG